MFTSIQVSKPFTSWNNEPKEKKVTYRSSNVLRNHFLSDTWTIPRHSAILVIVLITVLSPTCELNRADAIRCRTDRLSTTRFASIIVVLADGSSTFSADWIWSRIYKTWVERPNTEEARKTTHFSLLRTTNSIVKCQSQPKMREFFQYPCIPVTDTRSRR